MQVKFYTILLSGFIFFWSFQSKAQSTFALVRQVLQMKCTGSGCHSGSHPAFNVSLSESVLYNQLVNASPLNPAAAAKGDKLIKPGYVDRSFLLRKIAHGLNESNIHLDLAQTEGADMPSGPNPLSKPEIELIRQWILFGAPQTGDVVDTALINKYYREGGIDDFYPNHNPPPAGSGFQIYVGKVFIQPNYETYYFIKHTPKLNSDIEIPRIETMLPSGTHHFVIYKFLPGGENNYREGLRNSIVEPSQDSHADVLDGIGTGPNFWEYQLPAGTAYYWSQNTPLDLNLHIRNSSMDSVMALDLYINVFTQPVGTALNYMLIRNFPIFTISIPQDGQEHTFTELAYDSSETRMWKIWQLYTHTHKYGTDYDVFKRKPSGSMDVDSTNQIYEGWYSYEQGFMVGYYRTGVDVTFEFFPDDSLLEVDPRLGLIHRAKYRNTNGPDPVLWGLTSDEEMMVMGFQYIYGNFLSSVPAPSHEPDIHLTVFPNPVLGTLYLNYILQQASNVSVRLTDVLGKTISLAANETKTTGNYIDEIDLLGTPPGIYMVTFTVNNKSIAKRVIVE